LKLGKLIAFYDDNNITIDGETSLSFTEDVEMRYKAYGWQVLRVADGNTDYDGIRKAIADAKACTDKPTLIMVKTLIGYGSPNKANSHDAHGAPLGKDEAAATRKNLGWEYGEFEVPKEAMDVFRGAIPRGAKQEEEWNKKVEAYKAAFPELGQQFQDCVIDQKLPEGWENCLPRYKPEDTSFATRINSFKALNALGATIPGFVGGSADLAPSNMTLMSCSGDFLAGQYENKNFRFGVREFGMGAVSNAMALHKTGLIPYCATFLIFTDYMRNAIRIAALSQAGTIFTMTHDSVAVGEDGPTHQPVEIVGSLRMIPQLAVCRPCDGNETSGAYRMAVKRSNGMGEIGISGRPKTFPTLLALSRQVLPNQAGSSIEAVEFGAYTIQDCEGTPDLILIGTGSEVELCIQSANKMAEGGKKVRVVSMPCWEFFEDQTQEYKDSVLIPGIPTVSVEAGTSFGWHKYSDAQVAIDTYGASAPGDRCLKEFGMTVENVVATAMKLL
jgi:transketolase